MDVTELPGELQDWERLATNLRVEQSLLSALDLLGDLPVVVFKGGMLTRLIYGDLRRRASADNDLWIEEPHCATALQRLLQRGYRPVPGLDAQAAMGRYGQVALWPGEDFDQVSIDLHAQPFMTDLFSVEPVVLRRHLMDVEIHGRAISTFDRPLSLCHMVAHFLAHRLERHHLPDLGAAWDAWELDPAELRALSRQTCTEPALEHALGLAFRLGHCQRPPLAYQHRRTRVLRHIDTARRGEPSANRGRLYSFLLANPSALPAALVRAVFLEPDDLESRYPGGTRFSMTLQRISDLLSRG